MQDERALTILKDLFNEVIEAYQLVETYNDNYILLITENEENEAILEAADIHIYHRIIKN